MGNTILLIGINAKYIHSNLAIHSLKAYADMYYPASPDGCGIVAAEYTINQSLTYILADIYLRRPRVAAFSCYIWNWGMVRDLLAELPKVLPDTDIWLGGPEVSFDAEKILHEFPRLTGIMVGEGEETFLEILKYYREGRTRLEDIRGIVYSGGFTGERGLVDMDRLPFVYDTHANFEKRIVYYESQRGCPFRCAYCLSSIDRRVRRRDIDTVKSQLRYFLDHNVPQVKFVDRTFNCDSEYALAIWSYLKENDNGVTNFHFEAAADLLTDSQLEVIKSMRSCLIQLEIGVQSTNEATLEAINRRTDIGALRRAVAAVRSFRNTHLHLDLIAGLPYEDYDTFAISFNDVYSMGPDQLQLGFLKVLKGSPMERCAYGYGIVYGSNPPYEVLYTRWLSFGELLKLKEVEEMVEIYYNSGQFTRTLPVLALEFESPFRMYEALADYYHENGYFVSTPSRVYRYQVLLDFACSMSADRRELFAELLTFDLYLRENLKSRPAFSPENNIEKEKLHTFFEREAQEHEYLKAPKYKGCTPAQLLRMTHVELFGYPVWEEDPACRAEKLETPRCVLFDYESRDALTRDADRYLFKLDLA